MRLTLAALVIVLAAALIAVVAGNAGDGERGRGRSSTQRALDAGLLVRAGPSVRAACRTVTAQSEMPPRCPSALAAPDGTWGRARALDRARCEYLIDIEPGPAGGLPGQGAVFHLLFGGRCGSFDLRVRAGRWPARRSFPARDLRLVGSRPPAPGGTPVGRYFDPARPRVVRRIRVGPWPALVVRYPPLPLTTVHSGHLAIVWNEVAAGYVVSGHPLEDPVESDERDVVRALHAMAVGMTAAAPG